MVNKAFGLTTKRAGTASEPERLPSERESAVGRLRAPEDQAAIAADGSEAGGFAAGGRRLAVRAKMGRLPLSRFPRRRRGRAPVQGRASARALFPGSRRGGPVAARRAPGARRR